ncbi:MAG: S8 family serine peptidase [Anaerolinea sp.]|nr:S8 family serine peptidase [Anaerolinea sp.]
MRQRLLVLVLVALVAVLALAPVSAQEQPPPTATPGFGVRPVNPTSTPMPPVVTPIRPGDPRTIRGTEIAPPTFDPPPTLEELFEQYPDLQPFVEEFEAAVLEDIDFSELYTRIVTIFDEQGGAGLAVFLTDTGIMEKLGLPVSYLDLLTEYDETGLEGVAELARERGIINAADELVGYLALESEEVLPEVTEVLTGLGVSVYDYLPNTEEVEIGVPLAILAQYQTPGTLIEYLVTIANVPGVVGFRGPVPSAVTDVNFQIESVNGDYVNTDDWNKSGFTGQGLRIGVLDVGGFAGVVSMIDAGELPEDTVGNYDLEDMEFMFSDHGTACAIVIHRVVPDADLFVAYYDGSDSSFFDALEFFADNDVQIVSYSGGSSVGPRDGTWGQAVYVNEFVEETGILWVNSAGNEALSHTMWQYNPGEEGWHDFGGGEYWLPFIANSYGAMIALNWNGNWNGREDAFFRFTVQDEAGNEVGFASEPKSGRRNDFPFQFTAFETEPGETYYLAIQGGDNATTDHVLDIFTTRADVADWAVVPGYSVSIPGDASSSLTVAALGRESDRLETYSSQGPRMDGSLKPDIAAPTGEQIPGYDTRFGFNGTSGAAPLVAAAAALVMEAYPDLSQEEVRAFLLENAVDLGDRGEDPQFGVGRLDMPAPDAGGGGGGRAFDPPSGSDPTAEMLDTNVQFGVRAFGEVGMQVTMSFQVDNLEGEDVAAVLVFTDQNGDAIPSPDENYEIFGSIGAYQVFTVLYDSSVFSDVVLFAPDYLFEGMRVGTELFYQLAIIDLSDTENLNFLYVSDPVEIQIVER